MSHNISQLKIHLLKIYLNSWICLEEYCSNAIKCDSIFSHILLFCHFATLSSCYFVILSSCHHIQLHYWTDASLFPYNLDGGHYVFISRWNPVNFSSYHHIILSTCHLLHKFNSPPFKLWPHLAQVFFWSIVLSLIGQLHNGNRKGFPHLSVWDMIFCLCISTHRWIGAAY